LLLSLPVHNAKRTQQKKNHAKRRKKREQHQTQGRLKKYNETQCFMLSPSLREREAVLAFFLLISITNNQKILSIAGRVNIKNKQINGKII